MQAVVQKWGNSLGFRIPSFWAKDNNVRSGSKIVLDNHAINGCILIDQVKNLDWTQRNCDFIEKATEGEINSVVDNIKLMIE